MKRWLAITVAVLIAAAGAVSWHSSPADAGVTQATLSVDCNTSTGGIQSNCILSQGTVTVDVYYTWNDPGGLPTHPLVAWQFVLVASPGGTTTFVPPAVSPCTAPSLNCNPDFNQSALPSAGWDCSTDPPDNDLDSDGDSSSAQSFIACFDLSGADIMSSGTPVALARVTYNVTADGVYNLSFNDTAGVKGTAVYGENFEELGSCFPLLGVPMDCNGATVQIGASANTATPTNTAVPTNTPIPTATPCSGASCPTPTSLAYRTVTPTGTATLPATNTPAPGQPTAPPPPPGGGGGGGGTAGGGGGGGAGGGIKLPDTGSGGQAGTQLPLAALGALALAAALAGGMALSIAAARRGED